MTKLLTVLILFFSQPLLANEKPITNTFNCIEKGCSLSCMNSKNNWSTISSKAENVKVTHYSSGNIEYLLSYKDKARGNEAIFISNFRLQCRLSGAK